MVNDKLEKDIWHFRRCSMMCRCWIIISALIFIDRKGIYRTYSLRKSDKGCNKNGIIRIRENVDWHDNRNYIAKPALFYFFAWYILCLREKYAVFNRTQVIIQRSWLVNLFLAEEDSVKIPKCSCKLAFSCVFWSRRGEFPFMWAGYFLNFFPLASSRREKLCVAWKSK